MKRRSALPTTAARTRVLKLAKEGASAFAIASDMTRRRYRNARGGTTWSANSVRALLKSEGVDCAPRQSPRTSEEAIALIVAMCEATPRETREALEESGLKTARGGPWRDVTIRRLRERYCGISTKRLSDAERFDANVRLDPTTGCELWTGAMQDGRGKFEVNGQHELAHRWNYERAHGPIPEGHQLHHACRTPRCVAIGHLIPVASPQEHAALEREEELINIAACDGRLAKELSALGSDGWPEWTDSATGVGARRVERPY